MNEQPPSIAQLASAIQTLTETMVQCEQRLRRLQRIYRWGGLAGVMMAGLVLHAISDVAAQNSPREGWLGKIEDEAKKVTQITEHDFQKLAADARHITEDERAKLAIAVDRLRERVHQDKVATETVVAVVLHDMKVALESMPSMARDMERMRLDMSQMNAKMNAVPVMAVEMAKMNATMRVMGAGVDSTMGRMGRMMPWNPW
jgi:hypothetical protein